MFKNLQLAFSKRAQERENNSEEVESIISTLERLDIKEFGKHQVRNNFPGERANSSCMQKWADVTAFTFAMRCLDAEHIVSFTFRCMSPIKLRGMS